MKIIKTDLKNLHQSLGWKTGWEGSPPGEGVPFKDWKMEHHDAPIFEYLYRNHLPKRHLEFGTWYGYGATLVLKNTKATVWTINLWEGEKRENGENAYGLVSSGQVPDATNKETVGIMQKLIKRLSGAKRGTGAARMGNQQHMLKASDSGELIGKMYRDESFGHRVNQIYCSSLDWDTANYPEGFFDSILVDGGHDKHIVCSDTQKSLPLLRSGGLMMWHDYCTEPEIIRNFSSSRGVVSAIETMTPMIAEHFESLYWIYPSFILLGIKK